MKTPSTPANEAERQSALDATSLVDTAVEERFDRYTRLASSIFQTPIALVSLIDRDRQWFKSHHGLKARETPRDISFCGHAIHHSDLFIVEDARADDRFSDNPLVLGEPNIRFYAGAPLFSRDGQPLGTLCIIDRRPRQLSEEQQLTLVDLAKCVEREIHQQSAVDYYRELTNSERRARAIIEGTRIGTWEWNVQTGETVFNERWAEICGYRLEELEPVSIQTWLGLAHPDDLPESERRLKEHFAGQRPEYDFKCRMKHRKGHWVWVHDRGRVFEWTKAGEPLMMFGTHADITEEKNNFDRIQQQNSALEILNRLALTPETDDDARIQTALDMASEFLELPLAIVSEITSRVYSIRYFLAPEESGLEKGQSFALQDTYCSLLVKQRDSLAISHMADSQFRDHRCYELFGLESYLAAPIYVQDKLFGTLNFSSPDPRVAPFSDVDVTFVTLLARWIGAVLERKLSVQMLTKLVDQTPGVLYQYRLWPDGRAAFPFSSPHIRDIYGLESHEVRDDASAVFDRIHPDDLDHVADSIDRSANTLSIWHDQYRVQSTSNESEWRWVEGKASPEKMPDDSVVWHGYIGDIDEQKRITLALHESEAQLRRLFELSPIGIALIDFQSGQFLDINQALLAPTGFSRETLMSQAFDKLLPADFEAHRGHVLDALTKEGRFGPLELDICKTDNSTYPALVQGVRIIDAADRPLVWTLVEDISERKKVDRMKTEFVSTVSHELRTPLTSITGSLGLIVGGALGKLPQEADRMLAIAHRNSSHLKHLVDDLLDMEKLVSGKMIMTIKPEPAIPLIEETIDKLTFADDRHIAIEIDDQSATSLVMADRLRLGQALTNLLSNAVKFSPTGSTVTVTVKPRGAVLRILVSDQGDGVPEDFQPHLFEKFAQADSSDTRSKGGTGLGLAITREIMVQMAGEVGFEPNDGKGATFWLELPLSTGKANNA